MATSESAASGECVGQSTICPYCGGLVEPGATYCSPGCASQHRTRGRLLDKLGDALEG